MAFPQPKLQRLFRSASRLDVQLANRQALNVKLLEPPLQQAKSSYAQRSNRESADRCRAQRKHANGRGTQCDCAQSRRT